MKEICCNNCGNYDIQNGCDGDYDYMCECTDNEYKYWKPYQEEIRILVSTIHNEINRMCITKDLAELEAMALCAQGNIERLLSIRYCDFK